MFDWKKTLHIIRGLPGEGKSTLALQIVGNKEQVVENDDYWMMPYQEPARCPDNGETSYTISQKYVYATKMAHLAGWACFAEAFRRLRIYDEVAVANTFVLRKHIIPYIEEAWNLKVKVKIHRPTTPWVGSVEDSFKRNLHSVPMDVIEKMNSTFEPFTQTQVDALLNF